MSVANDPVLMCRVVNYTFTTKMEEYIRNGYYLNMRSMQGLQTGELARIDLIREEKMHTYNFIRIWVTYDNGKYFIRIGGTTIDEERLQSMWMNGTTIWNIDLDIIDKIEVV